MAYKYCSVQLSLPPDLEAAVQKVQGIIAQGMKTRGWPPPLQVPEPHITVKYGLTGNPEDIFNRLVSLDFKILDGIGVKIDDAYTVLIGRTAVFRIPPKDDEPAQDVVKINVNSPSLNRMNQIICQNVPHADGHPDFLPHITLAYLHVGAGQYWDGINWASLSGISFKYTSLDFCDTEGNKRRIWF